MGSKALPSFVNCTDLTGLTMTTKNPVNSVHDEQFDADKKASESTGEELTETTTQEQPAAQIEVENEPVLSENVEPVTEEPVEEPVTEEPVTEEPVDELSASETPEEDDSPETGDCRVAGRGDD